MSAILTLLENERMRLTLLRERHWTIDMALLDDVISHIKDTERARETHPAKTQQFNWYDGPITRREMFAGMAMQGALSGRTDYPSTDPQKEILAIEAWRIAEILCAKDPEES